MVPGIHIRLEIVSVPTSQARKVTIHETLVKKKKTQEGLASVLGNNQSQNKSYYAPPNIL